MTALITVLNASEGWRSIILGCLILAMLPILVLFLFLQRQMIKGLTAGAVKS